MKVVRFDIGRFKKPKITHQGFLRADAYATRAGIFVYRKPDGTVQKEFRPPEEVFKKDSLDSLSEIPLTNDHPSEMINSENSKHYSVGFTGEKVDRDGELVKVGLTIMDAESIKAIQDGKKVELSCGYTCDMDKTPGDYKGERYDAVQRNIIYNHLALVEKGRAGSEVRVRLDSSQAGQSYDSQPDYSKNQDEGEAKMPMAKIKIDSVEYEIPEGVAKVVSDKISQLDSLNKEHETLKGRCDALKAEIEKKDKEIADVKKSIPDQKTCVEIAKKRLDLEETAKTVLDEEFKFDSLCDIEIKKHVIQKLNPDLKMDGKSDEYVEGCFETLKANLKKDEGEEFKSALRDSFNSPSVPSSEAVRIASMKRDSEAWKPKEAR